MHRHPFYMLPGSLLLLMLMAGCATHQLSKGKTAGTKPVIYQVMVRLFGNQDTANVFYGPIKQNGVGKFADITDKALDSIKSLGITHIWYTGVLEHATMTSYAACGIPDDDPDVVKGRAGSPYAVKDYYDVDPDLAVHLKDRMAEFESLVHRTHVHKLKVLMDFIPNHVARGYHSTQKPLGVIDFGARDDTALAFSPQNDFYYLPGSRFKVPTGVDAGGVAYSSPLKDNIFFEVPAKATGNNVFSPEPSIDDWYETVKLNYGVDIEHGRIAHFSPIPPVWTKMRDILLYWAGKGIDGFRCDVAEMVPVQFWHWVIPAVKSRYPKLIFIAEAYSPEKYAHYIHYGQFDYLYNKVGLYDALKPLIKNDSGADVSRIAEVMQTQDSISGHMLNFLENHDEQRLASRFFAGSLTSEKAGMGLAATISTGPVLIYFGQELGEKAGGAEGLGGDDGKTTLFDYWGVPAMQQWANSGRFDGGGLDADQKELRAFYKKLLHIAGSNEAITTGRYQRLIPSALNGRQFCFLRTSEKACLLVLANFDRQQAIKTDVQLPASVMTGNYHTATELMGGDKGVLVNCSLAVDVPPGGFQLWELH
ncbi:MAG TPA: alpha-amylase family glycosyl hydrolase [Arachidicoccus sp.]|nr:alpha-amylase family glycosyl hydrolase [Arachidicoccus sp.]